MVAAASTMTPIAQTIYIIPTAMELFFARFHFTAARYMALKTSARKKNCRIPCRIAVPVSYTHLRAHET